MLPPLTVQVARDIRNRLRGAPAFVGWRARYASFEEAARVLGDGTGYADPRLVEGIVADYKDVEERARRQLPGLDSRSVRLFAAIAHLGLLDVRNETVRILDFGGQFGAHFFRLLPLRPPTWDFEWHVCELPATALAAKKNGLERERLRFFGQLSDLPHGNYHLVHASGTLQVVDDLPGCLDALAARASAALLLGRMPLGPWHEDFVTIAYGSAEEHRVPFPAWFFSSEIWTRRFDERGLFVDWNWDVPEDLTTYGDVRLKYSALILRHSRVRYARSRSVAFGPLAVARRRRVSVSGRKEGVVVIAASGVEAQKVRSERWFRRQGRVDRANFGAKTAASRRIGVREPQVEVAA
jgi:putative methyltransferase (TIGR04325 family)